MLPSRRAAPLATTGESPRVARRPSTAKNNLEKQINIAMCTCQKKFLNANGDYLLGIRNTTNLTFLLLSVISKLLTVDM